MANFNFNKVILGGRLCSDPELKKTNSGVAVVTFTLAVNRRFGEKQADGTSKTVADFIKVTAWRQTAEFICSFFKKGSNICIVGSIQTRNYTDKNNEKRYVVEVVADEASFVDAKNDSEGTYTPTGERAPQSEYEPHSTMSAAPQFETIADGEELPF